MVPVSLTSLTGDRGMTRRGRAPGAGWGALPGRCVGMQADEVGVERGLRVAPVDWLNSVPGGWVTWI
jgi:hypothetical protein